MTDQLSLPPGPVELLPPGCGPVDERWHELRRAGVSASEIAAVLGISPWESPFSLYWRKVNGWTLDDNDILTAGRYVEDAAASWWIAECDPLENMQLAPAGLYAHPDRPWQLATPDRLILSPCDWCDGRMLRTDPRTGDPTPCQGCDGTGAAGPLLGLLECKWVAYSWDGWGEPGTDDIPVYYRAQALQQLDVMGVDEVHFAVLGPGGFRTYGPIRRDDKDLRVMRAAGGAFAERLRTGGAPDIDGHTATIAALRRLHPSLGDGPVEVPVELAEGYRRARALKKAVEARIDSYEARLRAALGSTYSRAECGGRLVASRSIYQQSGDTAELTAIEDDWPVVDRLNPGRAKTYA